MSRQYLRKVSLLVGDQAGDGLDLSELRIRFATQQWDAQTPNNLWARIYNVSDLTAARARFEFKRVVLRAGYEGSYGTIFDGTIKQTRQGRENPTDTYLDIFAGDGDIAYNWGVANVTLAAGSTARDVILAMIRVLEPHGVTLG